MFLSEVMRTHTHGPVDGYADGFSSIEWLLRRGGGDPSSSDLSVNPEVVVAGAFQSISLSASEGMSVYIPYLIKDPETGFVQNTTVVDIGGGDTVVLEVLVPPRTDGIFMLVGEYGRGHWPIRGESESWETWLSRGGTVAWTARARSGCLRTTLPLTAWRSTQ